MQDTRHTTHDTRHTLHDAGHKDDAQHRETRDQKSGRRTGFGTCRCTCGGACVPWASTSGPAPGPRTTTVSIKTCHRPPDTNVRTRP
eukprot:3822434-Rhodomonas_salina.4